MSTLVSEAILGLVFGVPIAVGLTLVVLVFPFRVFRGNPATARGVAVMLIPILSWCVAFLAIAWLSAQVILVFAMIADCVDGQCIPYISEDTRGVVANQLFLRLIAPPPLQQLCFGRDTGSCAVAQAIVAHPSFREDFPLLGWGGFLRATVLRTYGALLTGILLPAAIYRRGKHQRGAA